MDINQLITLGIGTPSGIKEFLTFGLQIGVAAALPTGLVTATFTVSQANATFTVTQSDATFTVTTS